MLFSIVIPAYNCSTYLGGCVSSVLSQGFVDYEIILVEPLGCATSLSNTAG